EETNPNQARAFGPYRRSPDHYPAVDCGGEAGKPEVVEIRRQLPIGSSIRQQPSDGPRRVGGSSAPSAGGPCRGGVPRARDNGRTGGSEQRCAQPRGPRRSRTARPTSQTGGAL